ncbi:amidase [Cupriavidus necator]|uniref:Amidase n=1 Tax=Cupriavidus necator TaxID=106590 RepID=A0A1U9UZW6_CUPNE|nr:amidase [Cupriavidus necator]AQV98230.1 amidase [Cupriavidus necator]
MPDSLASAALPALDQDEYLEMDATEMAAAVSMGELDPAALLGAAIARCDAIDPVVHSVNMRHDAHARAHLRQLASAGLLRTAPLAGVPMLIKDMNTYLAGTKTTNGSRFLAGGEAATHSSTIVQRYEEAGMLVFGKTTTPEFGLATTTESALWGQTRNPWNLGRSAGGSSGGAAAAVAAGIVPVAHATDGGGSIRIPAAYCGVFGLKPTRYRTPHGPGAFEGWFGASCGHVVSRTVRDSALVLDVSHGRERGSPYWLPAVPRSFVECQAEDPGPLRIGLVSAALTGVPLDPEIAAILQATARLLEAMGHRIEPAQLPVDPASLFGAHGAACGAALVTAIRDREAAAGREATADDLEPITFELYQRNKASTAENLFRSRRTFDQVAFAMDRMMEQYDVLLSPVTAIQTPALGDFGLNQPYASYAAKMMGSAAFTVVANVSGQPSMSVPSGFTADGMPVGMMFTAALCREDILFSLAGQLERARPWTLPPTLSEPQP